MAEILIRNLDPKTLKRLKDRAKRNGRSLQGEAKLIIENAAGFSPAEARTISQRWQRTLSGRRFTDSTEIIREDRRR